MEGYTTNERTANYSQEQGDMFAVSYTPIRAGIYNIYLFGTIYDASQFIGAIEVLQNAGDNDVVVIHLSTNGGSLDAADTFISAMKECDARIVVKASGGVHSAGTLILLAADEFSLSDNVHFLIHNGSCGSGGKFSDWRKETKHTERYMEQVMRTSYAGFMSDDEINDLLEGKDYWLTVDDFMDRYNKRNEYYKELIENSKNEVLEPVLHTADVPATKKRKPRKAKEAPNEV